MKLTKTSLNNTNVRTMIRRGLKQALVEAVSTAKKPPKTFGAFRKAVGAAVKQAGGPQDLVDEIEDVGYEGGGVVGALGSTWRNIEYEYSAAKKLPLDEQEDEMWDTYLNYVHDCVIDMAAEYRNAWNYEPGHKSVRFDAVDLAQRVENILDGVKLKRADKGALKKMKGDFDAADIMRPLATVIKSKSKTTKVIMRMGGIKGSIGDSPVMDISNPSVKDTARMIDGVSTKIIKILADMGCEQIKKYDSLDDNIEISAHSYNVNTDIKKVINIDFEDLGPGKIRAYFGVNEGR